MDNKNQNGHRAAILCWCTAAIVAVNLSVAKDISYNLSLGLAAAMIGLIILGVDAWINS